MEIKIKKIREKDVPEVYKLYEGWVMNFFPEYSEYTRKKMLTKPFGKKFVLDRAKRGIALMAVLGQRMVGVFIADPPVGGLSYAMWLMVDKDFRGRGIARSLLKAWEEEAKKQGCHNLRLEADHRNVGFYEKMKFDLIGLEKKGYFGTDNYLFQKIIGEPNEEKF